MCFAVAEVGRVYDSSLLAHNLEGSPNDICRGPNIAAAKDDDLHTCQVLEGSDRRESTGLKLLEHV